MRSRAAAKPGARVASAGLWVALLAGCVANSATDRSAGTEVVERSKEEQPPWTAQAADIAISGPSGWRVLTVRTKLLNLPLGLKQTQLGALEAAPATLGTEARAQLLASAGAQAIVAGADQAELTRLARTAAEQAAGPDARIGDIYFEQVVDRSRPAGDPMAQYYTVYVLVTFPPEVLARTMAALAPLLQASHAPGLSHLAAAAQALASRLNHK